MSLKAKIEAVIYASEEPVTLQQLVGLLGQEAQAELDAADALQGQLALLDAEPVVLVEEVESGDQDALNAETLGTEVFAAIAPAEDDGSTEVVGTTSQGGHETTSRPALAGTIEGVPAWQESPAEPGGSSDDPEPGPTVPEADRSAAVEPSTGESGPTELTPAEVRARERRLREYMRSVLDGLIAEYANSDRGLEIREIAGGYRFGTKPEYHDAVRGFVRSLKPPLKLSLQALETLAVVAYKQPVTAPEVSEIRGVDSAGVLGSLIGRKLVATAGRKQVIGRPILYKTTKDFLVKFGLKDLNELPSIEEFERLASDLNEAVQEEIPMPERLDQIKPTGTVGDAARAVEPMRAEHAAQPDGIPDQQSDAEHTMPAPEVPGEFTGNESAPTEDNANVDGRLSGLPPTYDAAPEAGVDSPALDAEVQSQEAGSQD